MKRRHINDDALSDAAYAERLRQLGLSGELVALQLSLHERGYGSGEEQVMRACWKEAVRRVRKRYAGGLPKERPVSDAEPANGSLGIPQARKTREKRRTAQGVTAGTVIRWCGSRGIGPDRTKRVLEELGLRAAPPTLRVRYSEGAKGIGLRGVPAALAARLERLAK